MIKINKKRGTESEVEEKLPSIQTWLIKKKNELELSEITSVEVQIKDIKQMKYSEDIYLQTLYRMVNHMRSEEDFIILSKHNKNALPYIWQLLHTSWLINEEEMEKKTNQEIEAECLKLMQQMKRKTQLNQKKLIEYKWYCLQEYLLQRKLRENVKEYSLQKVKMSEEMIR